MRILSCGICYHSRLTVTKRRFVYDSLLSPQSYRDVVNRVAPRRDKI